MDPKRYLIFLFSFLVSSGIYAAKFRVGEEKKISGTINDNLYVAGSSVSIDAIVNGDLAVAGRLITVNDTVFDDMFLAGQDVLVNSYIADDVRILGENIKIMKSIKGDLIIGGSEIQIHQDAEIKGDLIILGGYAVINGTVDGNIKILGGRVVVDGNVNGRADIKAEELIIKGKIRNAALLVAKNLELEDGAQFHDSVTYWREGGEMDFSPFVINEVAVYNADLKMKDGEVDWKYLGMGMFTFWVLYTLSVLFTISILVFLFQKTFSKAGERINHSYIHNFGYGALFFAGIPFLIIFLMATIIGIPIGFVLLHLFVFSLLFAYSVTSVVLAYGINFKYNKRWNKWNLILVAAIVFPVLKLITLIPFLGLILTMIITGVAFGALIQPCLPWTKRLPESDT